MVLRFSQSVVVSRRKTRDQEGAASLKREYDMTGAMRATEVEHLNRLRSGKMRITIMLDDDVLEDFRARAEEQGTGYQTAINLALREYLTRRPIDEETLRRVLREELHPA